MCVHRELLKDDPAFHVPEVISELSTGQVLTTEFVNGIPLDKLDDADQATKDFVSCAEGRRTSSLFHTIVSALNLTTLQKLSKRMKMVV